MTIITIRTNQILLDRAMKQYLMKKCDFTSRDLKAYGLKPLPPRMDTTVGNLKPEKIADIDRAYKTATQSNLPIPQVNRVTESYYSVQDGRHRIVMAICNRVATLKVDVLNQVLSRSKTRSRSRSRSKSKSRSNKSRSKSRSNKSRSKSRSNKSRSNKSRSNKSNTLSQD